MEILTALGIEAEKTCRAKRNAERFDIFANAFPRKK